MIPGERALRQLQRWGFDPHVHPGVRPGYFGESYFNFSLLGVIVVGLAIGIIWRRVDIDVKRALTTYGYSMRKAFASTTLLGVAGVFAISANSSGFLFSEGYTSFRGSVSSAQTAGSATPCFVRRCPISALCNGRSLENLHKDYNFWIHQLDTIWAKD